MQNCQHLNGFSFSRLRICITHYLYNTHVTNFKYIYIFSENCFKLLKFEFLKIEIGGWERE